MRALGALVWLAVVGPTASQDTPRIRVPVRLVTVPTLVLGADNRPLADLQPGQLRLFDQDRGQTFSLDTSAAPLSIVIAIQANLAIREYLPFVAKVGSTLEALLVGSKGEAAILVYGDDVTLASDFGAAGLSTGLHGIAPDGIRARAIDAGLRGLGLLAGRPASHTRVLLFIGQPEDDGSEYRLEDLRREAERAMVSVHAFALPLAGKAFVSDTFSLEGLSSSADRGGFKAGVDLTNLIPVLSRSAAASRKADPFSMLVAATGGTLLHFRKQTQLEDAISILGVELRSLYTLSFPPSGEAGYHALRVESTIPGARTHARPGYWLD